MNKIRAAAVASLALMMVATVVIAQQGRFSDVPDYHPDASAIEQATEAGWFQGGEDGLFRPNDNITAGQMSRVLERAFPDGLRRGQFASFMVAGHTTLPTTTTTTTPEQARATEDSPPWRGDPTWRPTLSDIQVFESGGHGPDIDRNHRICLNWQVDTAGAPALLMTEWQTEWDVSSGRWFYSQARFQHWYEWAALVEGEWKYSEEPTHLDWPQFDCAGWFEDREEIQAVVIKAIAKPVVTDNIVKRLLPPLFHALRTQLIACERIRSASRYIYSLPPLKGWAKVCDGKFDA